MVVSVLASVISSGDRAERMADLQLQVPQQVEHRLDRLLDLGGRLGAGQEHQVEVAERRHLAAPGAAQPDDRQLGRIGARHMLVSEPDELGVEISGGARGGAAALGRCAEPRGDLGAALLERLRERRCRHRRRASARRRRAGR